MLDSILLLTGGLAALCFGAEWLVRGSVGLGLRWGISPLITGLTIVAFGTSAPELVVSLVAAFAGQPDIALGNVIGSNIVNIGLILGLTVLIIPLRVESRLVRQDIPILIGATVLFLIFFRDHRIARWEAGILLVGLAAYIGLQIHHARGGGETGLDEEFQAGIAPPIGPAWKDATLTIFGILLLVLGSKYFVGGATGIAQRYGVSDAVIGLTVVALGTSLPELAASLAAAFKQHADVAVGNIVGSCIFNIFAILGFTGLIAGPLTASGITGLDFAVLTVLAVLLIPFARSGFTLNRWEGAILVALFVGYQYHLFQR